jgi:hypothetical protein
VAGVCGYVSVENREPGIIARREILFAASAKGTR